MRFTVGAIPRGADFLKTDHDWRPIREPGPFTYQVLAVPLAAILVFFILACIWTCGTVRIHDCSMPRTLLLMIISIPLHELVHILVHPRNGRSEKSILGFWPAKLVFYAHYEGEMRKARFIAILAAPWLAFSALPLVVLCIFALRKPILAEISLANALLASGDVLGILLIMAQVPRNARVRNLQWRTFWKKARHA